MGQAFETEQMNVVLAKITEARERVKKVLDEYSELIEKNVGAAGKAWSGDSAVDYKNRWDQLAQRFPDIVNEFVKQEKNAKMEIDNVNMVNMEE